MTPADGGQIWAFADPQTPLAPGARLVDDENRGFSERATAWFLVPGPRNWCWCIDDAPLALGRLELNGRSVLAWPWTPGFYAGEVTAELLDPDGRLARRFLLDVAPRPDRVGRYEFAAMIEAVWARDPGLILGQEPAKRAVGTGSGAMSLNDTQAALIAFARLRHHAPAAVRAVRRIGARPIQRLRGQRRRTPIGRVRRIDAQSIAKLVHQPELAAALLDDPTPEAMDSGPTGLARLGTDTLLDTPATEPDMDRASNRCITAMASASSSRIWTGIGRGWRRWRMVIDPVFCPLALARPAR